MVNKAGVLYHDDQIGMSIRNGSATVDAFTRTLDGQPIDQRMRDKTTGTINRYYYLADGLGSVVALVDAAGSTNAVSTYKYDPYGNDAGTTGTVTSRFRFAGGYLSTTLGLYKFGERWYDPSTGRWLQQDLLEDPLAQKGWNRYDYAGDDPVNLTDRSGERPGGPGASCSRHTRRGQLSCPHRKRRSGSTGVKVAGGVLLVGAAGAAVTTVATGAACFALGGELEPFHCLGAIGVGMFATAALACTGIHAVRTGRGGLCVRRPK